VSLAEIAQLVTWIDTKSHNIETSEV